MHGLSGLTGTHFDELMDLSKYAVNFTWFLSSSGWEGVPF